MKKWKGLILAFLIIIGIYFLIQGIDYLENRGKYSETVCLRSVPNYCEYERMMDQGDGVMLHQSIIPGWMLHSKNPPYSDRRMPQFNFHTIVGSRNDTPKYCRGLTWINVPCDEPHMAKTVLVADNSSVYWWEKYVKPYKTGKYPINNDNYTYL